MSVRRDLQNAATLLREMGWCQAHFEDDTGARCALAAIEDAIGTTSSDWLDREAAASDALREVLPDQLITSWNDELGRTAEEVIAALEAAAEAAADE